MVLRGLLRRCPRCGARKAWYTGWFRRGPRCLTCGYRYERQDGFSLGAAAVNTAVTFGVLFIVGFIGVIMTWPDLNAVAVLVPCVVIAVVLPVVFYPISYTLWAAVDLASRPLEPAEEAEAATAAASMGPTDPPA
jgi:uncharacterized protein (DUF983 family)